MAKNKNLTFTIEVDYITLTFTYYPKRETIRVSSYNQALNETTYRDFCEPSLVDSGKDSPDAYELSRRYFMDILFDKFKYLFAPIERKFYELPF